VVHDFAANDDPSGSFSDAEVARVMLELDRKITRQRRTGAMHRLVEGRPLALPVKPTWIELAIFTALAQTYGPAVVNHRVSPRCSTGQRTHARVQHACIKRGERQARRVEHAADLDSHEVKAHEDGRWGMLVLQIDPAVEFDYCSYRLCAAEPLNATFEIAADDMAKVIPGEVIVLPLCLSGKTKTQIDERHMLTTTWKRIQGRTESAAKPCHPPEGARVRAARLRRAARRVVPKMVPLGGVKD
jgi:hypothetical protein